MEMERVGRASSVVLLFVTFRDEGDVLGYPLDEFMVEIASVAARPRGFRGLLVRNATFASVEDTYIQRGEGTVFGRKAQLKVGGSPESGALMKFDVSVLNGAVDN